MTEFELISSDDRSVYFVTANEKEQKKFKLEKATFRKMLEDHQIPLSGVPIVVISITGPTRSGKSLLLQLITLYYRREGWLDSDEWLLNWNRSTNNQGGMPCYSSQVRAHTQGVTAYGAPFILKGSNGRKIAVLLLDSEGFSDHSNSDDNDASLFTFCYCISSLQIFNQMNSLNAKEIEELQFLVALAKECTERHNIDTGRTEAVKDLCILLRDWKWQREYDYGSKGGGSYYTWLKNERTSGERAVIQDGITNSYKTVSCFLMPEPKKQVRHGLIDLKRRMDVSCDSNVSDLDPDKEYTMLGKEFIKLVKGFISIYLHPERLQRYATNHPVYVDDLLKLAQCHGDSIFDDKFKNIIVPLERCSQNFRWEVTTQLEEIENPKWKDFDEITRKSLEEATRSGKKTLRTGLHQDLDDRLEREMAVLTRQFATKRSKKINEMIEKWKTDMTKLHGKRFTNPIKIKTLAKDLEERLERLELDDRDLGDTKFEVKVITKENVIDAHKRNLKTAAIIGVPALLAGGAIAVTAGFASFLVVPVAAATAFGIGGAAGGTTAAGIAGGLAVASKKLNDSESEKDSARDVHAKTE